MLDAPRRRCGAVPIAPPPEEPRRPEPVGRSRLTHAGASRRHAGLRGHAQPRARRTRARPVLRADSVRPRAVPDRPRPSGRRACPARSSCGASRRSPTRDAYSTLMLKGLAPHVETSHALVVQWDGYVVNPDAWTDAFLDVDYCGAPWPWGDDDRRVGNGGFSLRSRRLIDALASPEVVLRGNEDETIGVHQPRLARGRTRHPVRARGPREPVLVRGRLPGRASRSASTGCSTSAGSCRTTRSRRSRQLQRCDRALAAILSLMRNCAAMGQWRAAHAIADAHRRGRSRACRSRAPSRRRRAARSSAARPSGRNDPCPCGSGKRYKLCHGALAAPAPPERRRRTRARAKASPRTRPGGSTRPSAPTRTRSRAAPAIRTRRISSASSRCSGASWASALPRLERAAAAKPDEPDFHGNLGLAYAAVDRLDDAIAPHRRAIALRPHRGRVHEPRPRAGRAAPSRRRDRRVRPRRWRSMPRSRTRAGTARIARLALGDRGAWADYEARLELPELGGRARRCRACRATAAATSRGRTLLVDARAGLRRHVPVRAIRPGRSPTAARA